MGERAGEQTRSDRLVKRTGGWVGGRDACMHENTLKACKFVKVLPSLFPTTVTCWFALTLALSRTNPNAMKLEVEPSHLSVFECYGNVTNSRIFKSRKKAP